MNPVKALKSGQFTSEDIGKTVYLSNSAVECQEWRIADVNHDEISGTVDLFPKYLLTKNSIHFSDGDMYYKNSIVRIYLNNDVYSGFTSEIQKCIEAQSFKSNNEILSDKIKCPSIVELGLCPYYSLVEGTIYPIFGTECIYGDKGSSIYNKAALMNTISGSPFSYWTRTRYFNDGYEEYPGNRKTIWCVGANAYASGSLYDSSNVTIVSIIRFGKQ